jgi:hypothetical protein
VNIAAYMAALDIDDLDPTAKHAVQVVAGRANQHSGVAAVSVARLAADMGVHRITAQRALGRAVAAGHLAVDKSPGHRSSYRVTCSAALQPPPQPALHQVLRSATGGVAQRYTKDSLDKRQEKDLTGDAARSPRGATGAAWGKPSPRRVSFTLSELAQRAAEREAKAAQNGDRP